MKNLISMFAVAAIAFMTLPNMAWAQEEEKEQPQKGKKPQGQPQWRKKEQPQAGQPDQPPQESKKPKVVQFGHDVLLLPACLHGRELSVYTLSARATNPWRMSSLMRVCLQTLPCSLTAGSSKVPELRWNGIGVPVPVSLSTSGKKDGRV